MKRNVKLFACAMGAVMLACVGLTACQPSTTEPPVTNPTTYGITADFNPEEGNVELSATSAAEGDTVTVTVTANDGYAIDWVSAEPATFSSLHYVELDENGVGSFTMGNSDVVVTARFIDVRPMPFDEYTVTVELSAFAAAHGKVSVSAPAVGGEYKHGETVILTVTPHEGYEVGTVTLNGEAFTGDSFEIETDTTVSATFYPISADLPAVEGLPSTGFGILFRSHWTNVLDGTPLFIGTNKMSLGEDSVTEVTPSGSGSDQSYRFTVGENTYGLSWLNFGYSVGYVLHLLDYTNERSMYFAKDPLPAANIEEHFFGEWIEENGTRTLKIEGDEVTFDGGKASVVVDLGFFEEAADEYRAPINSHMYYIFVNGTPQLLGWYPDGACPTVNAHTYIEDIPRVYTFSTLFQGTWKGLDGATELVITETELTVNGEAENVRGYNEYMFYVTVNGTEYEARISTASDFVLQLIAYRYDSNGLISGFDILYFVSDTLPEVSLSSAMYGTWSCPYADDVTVDASGILWGNDRAVVLAEGEARSDGYTYTVVLRGSVYTLSYLNLWAGYDDENDIPEDMPEWLFILEGTDGYYEFTAK